MARPGVRGHLKVVNKFIGVPGVPGFRRGGRALPAQGPDQHQNKPAHKNGGENNLVVPGQPIGQKDDKIVLLGIRLPPGQYGEGAKQVEDP